jgi:mRNA interferase RelE/StbE
MAWKISFDKRAEKQFAKLSEGVRLQVAEYLYQRVAEQPDPRRLGKALTGELKGFWRYRVGDYRIICELRDRELLILIIEVGHRREVYR